MLVLIAPDSFGALSAVEAATAIADGWRLGAPRDVVVTRPPSAAEAVAAREVRHTPDVDGRGVGGGPTTAPLTPGAARDPWPTSAAAVQDLDADVARAGLVVTGEWDVDWRSLRGSVVGAVAAAAQARGVPCVVVAGRAAVGRREAAAIGVDEVCAIVDHADPARIWPADPAGALTALARRVAEQWGGR